MIFEAETNATPAERAESEIAYQRALEQTAERLQYEQPLLENESDPTKLSSLWSYLKFETHSQKKPNISRAVCLFERAVASFPKVSQFWESFLDFLETHSNAPGKAMSLEVARRFVRNCPYSSRSWIGLLLALHRGGARNSRRTELDDALDRALKAPMPTSRDFLDVYQTYFDIRSDLMADGELDGMRTLFSSTIEYFDRWAPDLTWELWKSRALFEETRAKDFVQARAAYEHALRLEGAKKNALAWMDFVRFEERRGDANRVRSVLRQALNQRCDQAHIIERAYIEHERFGGGSIGDYSQALLRVSQHRMDSEFEFLVIQQTQAAAGVDGGSPQDLKPAKKKGKAEKERQPSRKRRAESELDASGAGERPAKRRRTDDNVAPLDLQNRRVGAKRDEDPLVVHVAGMTSDSIAALSPDELQKTFSELLGGFGPVRSVRTVPSKRFGDPPGALKPFVYVEFESPDGPKAAVNKKTISWDSKAPEPKIFELRMGFGKQVGSTSAAGRALLDSRAGVPPRPKYTNKNTLFITNVPFKWEVADLQKTVEAVAGAAAPVGIRLAADKFNPGKHRGFAYIEYTESADLELVAKALDGAMFEGRRLKAERSRPHPSSVVPREHNPPPPRINFTRATEHAEGAAPTPTESSSETLSVSVVVSEPQAPKKPLSMPVPRSVLMKKAGAGAPKKRLTLPPGAGIAPATPPVAASTEPK